MDKNNMSQNVGWICPLCGKVNSPNKNECDCTKNQNVTENQYIPTSSDGRRILTEKI